MSAPAPAPNPDDALVTDGARPHRRAARVSRATKETSIEVAVDLDGTGVTDIATGLPSATVPSPMPFLVAGDNNLGLRVKKVV